MIILTRLGVDLAEQDWGLGSALVRDALLQAAAIAERVGVRALLIHAETPEAATFYQRIDDAFEPSPTDPLHLILLMKDLRATIREEVKRVRSLGVGAGDIAEATGAEVGTVASWARAKRQPSAGYRARLLELIALIDRLSTTMDPGYVPLWLNEPLPALGDKTPLVALGKGRYKEVSKLVAELENDSFS